MAPDRGQQTKQGSSRAWEDLKPTLSEWIIDAMSSMNFTRMTPVQASTIPLFMAHKDVVVEAVTGSGKTLAFLIPIVERLLRLDEPLKKHHVGGIIISPTRELANQIHQVLLSLLQFHAPSAAALRPPTEEETEARVSYPSSTPKVTPQLLLGGSTTAAQDLSTFLKTSPNLLISTPGRLLEILSSPYVHCPQSSFEVLVLDEADRLLDLGFKDDLTKILNLLPKQRRTGLFSASVSEAVDQIIRVGLRNPVRIAVKVKGANGVEDKRTPASLQMTYHITKPSHKFPALAKLLQEIKPTPLRSIIFLSTCAAVDYFQTLLPSILPEDMILVPLHGKHPSTVRQKNFIRFTNSASPAVLLTTDVAARGLDIPSVDLVIQIDPPSDPKAFLHRCGRAGRAGRRGLSVVFLQPGREEDYIPFLSVRKTPIEPLTSPDLTTISDIDADENYRKFTQIVLQDRAVSDKAQRAFVSWVKSYSKHQASSIFRIADLDWPDLVKAWALVRVPKMPELKSIDRSLLLTNILPEPVNWDEYAYKDKQREKQRKLDLEKFRAEQQQAAINGKTRDDNKDNKLLASGEIGRSQAWSVKLEGKASKEVRRSKKEAKRRHEKSLTMTEEEKEKERETARMLEQVRREQIANAKREDMFEGFD